MIRAAALAAAVALVSSAAHAQPLPWLAATQASAVISSDPWTDLGETAAIDADDAYVFADAARSTALDADARAVAVKSDQDRMMSGAPVDPRDGGRVGEAFERFVALGPDGLAYASLSLARESASATRIARAATPQPSLVAMVLSRR